MNGRIRLLVQEFFHLIGILSATGGAKLGVAAERDELKVTAMWAAIHGATE